MVDVGNKGYEQGPGDNCGRAANEIQHLRGLKMSVAGSSNDVLPKPIPDLRDSGESEG